jgi:hypothetical protein
MRSVVPQLLAASALLVILERPALAQEEAGTFYVLGGIAFPHQEGVSGEVSVTYVTAPGGTTLGWSAGAGVFARSGVSIEGEVFSTGMMTAREPSRNFTTYNEERRDRFIGGSVRFHVRSRSSVHLEPVAGLCLIRHEGWVTSERVVFFPQEHVEISPRFAKNLPESLGVTAGADLRIGGRHFALMPSFRFVRQLAGGTEGDFNLGSNYPGGYPLVTFSGGVVARIDF